MCGLKGLLNILEVVINGFGLISIHFTFFNISNCKNVHYGRAAKSLFTCACLLFVQTTYFGKTKPGQSKVRDLTLELV